MKPKFRNFLLLTGSSMLAVSSASAQSNSWAGDSAGNWNDPARWTGGVTIASGADNTATFGNVITLDRIVTLGADRTIGNITASDTSNNYTISGANILTLDRTDATKPTINVTQSGRTLTINSVIAGTDGLLKTGAGTLILSGANSYSGGTEVNAGVITVGNNSAFGTGTITVTGNSTIDATYGSFPVMANALHVNDGVTLTTVGSTQYYGMTFSGAVTGSGTIRTGGSGNDANSREKLGLYSASNTFTGNLYNQGGGAIVRVNSLGDGGKLQLATGTGGFELGTGTATSLLFNTRQVELFGSSVIANQNTSASNTITINTDLTYNGTGVRTLTLGGVNAGINRFGGNIANNAGSAVSITKDGSGTWALGGTNTYSGDTNLTASSTTGLLIFQGSQALSANTTLKFAQASSNVQSVRFLDDGAGTINFNRPIEHGGSNTIQNLNIFVGNNNTANGGSSSGTTTGSTIQVGNITHTSLAADTNTWNLNATGANGYRLQTGTITLNNLANRTAGQTTTYVLNPTSANMTVAAITMATGNTGIANDGVPVLRLDGTSSNNIVTGAISNASDGPGFGSGQALSLQKQNSSTWTLQGTNTYTGTTTVSGGLLRVDGSLAAGSAVTVSGGAIGGAGNGTTTGIINGSVLVSGTGGIDLRNGSIGTLTLANTLNITGAAGANNLRFDMGNGTGTNDRINVAGATTLTNNQMIDLNWLGGASGRTPGTYTLIGGSGALALADFNKFSLFTTAAFGQTYTLVHDTVSDGGTGNLQVTAANVTAATPAAFWAGGGNNWSTTTNWRASLAGNDAVAGAPDFQTNVTFSTTTPTAANLTTNVLDTDFNINSLTFTNASGNVTIAGPGALTLEAAAVNGNTLGNGINSLKTSGTNTISARVGLAASQTWTVASGGTLAVSGVISDFGGGYSLTKAGGGTLTISTNPTYTGATILNGGTLDVSGISSGNPLSNSSGLIVTGTSTFIPRGAQPDYVLPTTTINGGVTANFTPSASGNNTNFTMASLSGGGTLSVATSGSGQGKNIVFGDMSNFTGVLQHLQGGGSSFAFTTPTLNDTVASNIRLAGAGSTSIPFRFQYNGSAGMTLTNRAFEMAGPTNSNLTINNNGTANSAFIINSNLAVTAAGAKTLQLGGTNTGGTSTFAGNIVDGTGAVISLTKADANTWTLTSANNSYTGATTISAGTLVIGGAGRLGSGNYAGNISNAGTFRYSSSADQILSGVISGAGATHVHAGTLTFAGSSSGTLGSIQVGGAGTPVLNIEAGSYTQGAGGFFVGGGAGGAGIVDQTGGTVAWNNNGLQLLIGNGGFAGTYNLSGGSLTTLTGTNTRGVMIGVNDGSSATFNLSGTGALTVAGNSRLMIGRSDLTQINTTNLFSQTGGTATISDMTMGGASGGAGSGNSATMTLTGGTFTATAFSLLSAANNDVSTINIGGTAVVTLPNLPTARGTNATATINFDGGTLRNSGTGTFITGLTNAFIMDGGAQFDTSLNSTTISQALLTHGSSLGGGLTKLGANTLTLSGANTYTGTTTVTGGTLKAGVASVANVSGAFGNNSAVTLADTAGVSLDITGFNTQIGSLTGGGLTGGNVTLGAATLTVGGDNTSPAAYAGVISGTDGALTKIGSGTQILSGDNTYTGATNVNDGTLIVNGNISTSILTTVAANATIGGTGTVGATSFFGTVSPGNSVGTLAAGNTIWNDGSSFLFEIDDATGTAGSSPGWDLLDITGTLDISGLTSGGFTVLLDSLLTGGGTNPGLMANFIDANTYSWEFVRTSGGVLGAFEPADFVLNATSIDNTFTGSFGVDLQGNSLFLTYTPAAVVDVIPEPSTALLGALGALLFFRRRR